MLYVKEFICPYGRGDRDGTWERIIKTDANIIASRDGFKENLDVYWDKAIENRARIFLNYLKYIHKHRTDPINGLYPFMELEGAYDGIPHFDVHPSITELTHENILPILEQLPKAA